MNCPKDECALVALGDSLFVCPECRRFYKNQLVEVTEENKGRNGFAPNSFVANLVRRALNK